MKRSQKPKDQEPTPAERQKPENETPRETLRIEALESRLAPHSVVEILD